MSNRDEKLKEFASKNIKIKDQIHKGRNYWSKEEYPFRYVYMSCPCGNDSLQPEELICDEEGNYSESKRESVEYKFGWKLFQHIERKIRLTGDVNHIKILIEVLGDEEALKLLEYWSKKNILIGLALQKYIAELKMRCSL